MGEIQKSKIIGRIVYTKGSCKNRMIYIEPVNGLLKI